ncbi:phosphatase PAP2 family protein [Leptospira sp. 96542]|nr:phosphatase PAP2 family protein [Leptospira sp. 96542]
MSDQTKLSPALPASATLLGLLLVLAWDALNHRYRLDARLADPLVSAGHFTLHDHWLLTTVLHDGARWLNGVLLLALLLMVWQPLGPLRQLGRAQRLRLWLVVASGMLLVSSLKRFSGSSCPWDLVSVGTGPQATLSHWQTLFSDLSDGGPGHCFPAGHASAGFAWVALYAALRPHAPRAARLALAAALLAGCALGAAQQLRGAHYMSHTLWTAWLCWAWACLWFWPARTRATLQATRPCALPLRLRP